MYWYFESWAANCHNYVYNVDSYNSLAFNPLIMYKQSFNMDRLSSNS